MSYKLPTRRKKKQQLERLNLVPILDAIFIFIFFLLMSAQFVKLQEIQSDVPIISNTPPPKNQKKPLALTLKITENKLVLYKGVPASVVKSFSKKAEGYPLQALHETLINIKKRYLDKNTIVLEPQGEIAYEEIVKIMDSIRSLKKTDEAIYSKDQQGLEIKLDKLFDNIIFGNTMS